MRSIILALEGVKAKRGLVETAARWFGLLGATAAAAAVVLVPVAVDPSLLTTNPTKAYYQPELRVLLAASAALLVAVMGMLIFSRRPFGAPLLVPALVFLGVSSLSTLFSERPVYSLYGNRGEGLLSLAAGVLLFCALALGLTSVARVRLFLAAAVSAAALVSVLGVGQNYGLDPITAWDAAPFAEFGRSFSTVGNSITLAAYLTLMMGATAALYLGSVSRAGRAAWLVALALVGACWIYAETRGALLGTGVALPVVLLAVRRRMGTIRPLVVPIAVLVAAMAVAVAASGAFGFSTLSARISVILLSYLALVGAFFWLLERRGARAALLSALGVLVAVGVAASAGVYSGNLGLADLGITRAEPSMRQYGDLSLQTRLYIWRDTVPMVLDRPLLGHGPDNFRKPARAYLSDEFKALVSDDEGNVPSLDRAHNHLLQVAATTGLLGLAAYLWVLVSYLRNAYRRGGWALAALSGGVLAYVVQIQTAFPSVATEVAFWGVLGASVALMRLRDLEPVRYAEGANEGPDKLATDVPVVGRRQSRRLSKKKSGSGELLVAVAVVGLLAAIIVPTFLEQREKAAKLEQRELYVEVRQAVERYERFVESSGTYPKDGVYTRDNPIRNLSGATMIRPSAGVTITTETTPGGSFTMEGRKTTLAGTFEYSYDSATGSYDASS